MGLLITKSLLDHLGLLGSGYLVSRHESSPRPRRARDGRKCHALPPSDPPATAALDRDRRAPGQPAGLVLSQIGAADAAGTTTAAAATAHAATAGAATPTPSRRWCWCMAPGRQQQLGAGGGRLQRNGYRVVAPQPAARSARRQRLPGRLPGDHQRPDRAGRPLLRWGGHHQRRHRQRQRQGAGVCRRLHRRPGPDVVGAGHRRARLVRGR
jgi:hypothetical protein